MKTGEMVSSRWMVSGPRPSSGMGRVTCWLGGCAPACERPQGGHPHAPGDLKHGDLEQAIRAEQCPPCSIQDAKPGWWCELTGGSHRLQMARRRSPLPCLPSAVLPQKLKYVLQWKSQKGERRPYKTVPTVP